jgi:hypothetical protein
VGTSLRTQQQLCSALGGVLRFDCVCFLQYLHLFSGRLKLVLARCMQSAVMFLLTFTHVAVPVLWQDPH